MSTALSLKRMGKENYSGRWEEEVHWGQKVECGKQRPQGQWKHRNTLSELAELRVRGAQRARHTEQVGTAHKSLIFMELTVTRCGLRDKRHLLFLGEVVLTGRGFFSVLGLFFFLFWSYRRRCSKAIQFSTRNKSRLGRANGTCFLAQSPDNT